MDVAEDIVPDALPRLGLAVGAQCVEERATKCGLPRLKCVETARVTNRLAATFETRRLVKCFNSSIAIEGKTVHTRSAELQTFLDVAEEAFTAHARDERSQVSLSRGFAALSQASEATSGAGSRLPVCDEYLAGATARDLHGAELRRFVEAFRSVEPDLTWVRRKGPAPTASANIGEGHANAMIFGPGGLEHREDVWLGVTLLAPDVRYPDHTHPPEETYLVMSSGEFSQDDGPWFEPGPGGSFYNPPGVLHAMRSGSEPLFAFWFLTSDAAA